MAIELGVECGDAFAFQFRILAALCPNAPSVLDCDTSTVYSRAWLRQMMEDGPVVNVARTIAIHDICDEAGDTHWIHTHGMDRLERVDPDLLDVPAEGVPLAQEMLDPLVRTLQPEEAAVRVDRS